MDNHIVFAENLRRLIDSKGKTRRQVSDDLGINYFTLTSWTNGTKYPRIEKIEVLARYFDVSKSDLIESKEHSTQTHSPSVKLLTDYVQTLSEEEADRIYKAIRLLHQEKI